MLPEEEKESMEKLLDQITAVVSEAFEKAGYEKEYGKVSLSNRPDLCEYQCNGAMAAAKKYHCAPIQIASKAAEELKKDDERIRSEYRHFMRNANEETRAELLPRYLPTDNEDEEEA